MEQTGTEAAQPFRQIFFGWWRPSYAPVGSEETDLFSGLRR